MGILHAFYCLQNYVNKHFKKLVQKYRQKTIWIQIRLGVLLGLICVQTVCKDYQQVTSLTIIEEKIKMQELYPDRVANLISYFVPCGFISI